MKTAAAYVRVSDERQEEFSPDSQIKRLRDYAEKNDMFIPDELVFRDDGISGKRADKRPAFNEMIAIAKQKEKPFDTILVWKFSRFARNQEESIVYKSLLRKNGVDVVSVSENIEDNPFGGLIERIIEWMDEYYVIRLSDEVRRGMTERATRGKPNTGPPYGYSMGNDGNYVINEEQAENVRQIFTMFLNGAPLKKISNTLRLKGVRNRYGNTIDTRGVEYILNNPVYNGWLRWNPNGRSSSNRNYNNPEDILERGSHEKIIDDEMFEETKKRLAERKLLARRYERSDTPASYMLKGLVKCDNCGATLTYNRKNNGIQCHLYMKGVCGVSHFINLDILNKMVIEYLEKYQASLPFVFDKESPNTSAKAPSINYDALIKSEKLKLERAKQAYQAGVDSLNEYRVSKSKIENEVKRLESERDSFAINNNDQDHEEFSKIIGNALSIIKNPSVSEEFKNRTLKTFISKIVFYKPEKSIQIFFSR